MKAALLIVVLAAMGCAARPHATPTSQPALVPVTVHLSGQQNDNEWGISVVAPPELSASKNADGRFQLTICNGVPDEVFVQVTGFESLGGKFERDGNFRVGGGSMTIFAHDRYELLHKAFKMKDGRVVTCGCGMARINAKIDIDDLKPWIGSTATIFVPISGYRRSNGESFHAFLDVPMKIVE